MLPAYLCQTELFLMLNWIIWNRTVFWHWNCTYTKLNCYITTWIKGIVWNRNVFWQAVYSCKTELFEIKLISYIKMDLALNNLQRLICHKTQQTNQSICRNAVGIFYRPSQLGFICLELLIHWYIQIKLDDFIGYIFKECEEAF